MQIEISSLNQKFHFHPFDPLERPLTSAIEADLAEINSGTACEQEKILIFESEVELGGLAQKILLPKNPLIQKYKNFTPLIRTKPCKKAVKACPIHAQKYKEISTPANSEIGIKV